MSKYSIINAIIDQVITTNGQQEITGALLNEVLKAMVESLGSDYQFGGVVVPSSNVGTPDQNVVYFATQAGTYTNFGNVILPDGISVLMWDGNWVSRILIAGSGPFDISRYKATNNNVATFADLSVALNGGNNIPVSLRRGGLSVKFVQSSDNTYVQWRLKTVGWSVDVSNWVPDNEDIRAEIMREINDAIASIKPIEITGNVTNAPDEEDLTSVNEDGTDVLKFNNKAYTPITYSGLGRMFLRKNLVNGVNTLTQDMFNKGEVGSRVPNSYTRFILQYDYSLGEIITHNITIGSSNTATIDGTTFYYETVALAAGKALHLLDTNNCVLLNGTTALLGTDEVIAYEDTTVYIASTTSDTYNNAYKVDNFVAIPNNCVLEFDGGSLSNGTIVGNNTCINANLVTIFNNNVILAGTWNVSEAYPEWFGANNGGSDNIAIQLCVDLFDNVALTNTYTCNDTITINKSYFVLRCPGVLNYTGNSAAVNIGGTHNDIFINKLNSPNGNGVILCGFNISELKNSTIKLNYCEAYGHCLYYLGDNELQYQFVQYNNIYGLRWISSHSSAFSVTFVRDSGKWFNSNYIYNVQCSAENNVDYGFEIVGPSNNKFCLDENTFTNISAEGGKNAIKIGNTCKATFYTVRFADNMNGDMLHLLGNISYIRLYGCNIHMSGVTNDLTNGLAIINGIIYNDKQSYSVIGSTVTIGYMNGHKINIVERWDGNAGPAETNELVLSTSGQTIDMSGMTSLGDWKWPCVPQNILFAQDGITIILSTTIFGWWGVSKMRIKNAGANNQIVYGEHTIYIEEDCIIEFIRDANGASVPIVTPQSDRLIVSKNQNTTSLGVKTRASTLQSLIVLISMRSSRGDTLSGLYHITLNGNTIGDAHTINEVKTTPYYPFGQTEFTLIDNYLNVTLNYNYQGNTDWVTKIKIISAGEGML